MVVTDDAPASADSLTELIPGTTVEELLQSPFVWIGTVDEIATKLQKAEDDLGVSRYVVVPRSWPARGLSWKRSPAVESTQRAATIPNVPHGPGDRGQRYCCFGRSVRSEWRRSGSGGYEPVRAASILAISISFISS